MKEILDGINYHYDTYTGKKTKNVPISIEPKYYCQRCGNKAFLYGTYRYWFNTGLFSELCDNCIKHYKEIEKKNHPMMAEYVDR
jgi:hypothetical protein